MCALLVEILLPVSAVIKVEASLPVARKFVSMLYGPCFESAKRGKHSTVSLERERSCVNINGLVKLKYASVLKCDNLFVFNNLFLPLTNFYCSAKKMTKFFFT